MYNDAFVLGGMGVVGKATMRALGIPYYFDSKGSNLDLNEGAKKKWCFICLPTPNDANGEQGKAIEVIRDYVKQIHSLGNCIFVIRSTVIPGTCRAITQMTGAIVCSNPEFLTEATADADAIKPRMIVTGSDFPPASRELNELWTRVPTKLRINTDTVTAEIIKYTHNLFAITKIVFANQIYDACALVGADYMAVHKFLHNHPWGSKHHFEVIHQGGRGAGGRCFPKDLKAFAQWSNLDFFKQLEVMNNHYLQSTHKG